MRKKKHAPSTADSKTLVTFKPKFSNKTNHAVKAFVFLNRHGKIG